jgi:hypothetical protein
MSLASRLLRRTGKGIAIASVIGLLLLLLTWQLVRAWWLHGYSQGTRTGILRKISYRGSPLCKYWSGELAVSGSSATAPEIWYFTVEGPADANPTVQAIQKVEASSPGKEITLSYREDRGRWWSCTPTDNFVTGVVSPATK